MASSEIVSENSSYGLQATKNQQPQPQSQSQQQQQKSSSRQFHSDSVSSQHSTMQMQVENFKLREQNQQLASRLR